MEIKTETVVVPQLFPCRRLGTTTTVKKKYRHFDGIPGKSILFDIACDSSDECGVGEKRGDGDCTNEWSKCVHPEAALLIVRNSSPQGKEESDAL